MESEFNADLVDILDASSEDENIEDIDNEVHWTDVLEFLRTTGTQVKFLKSGDRVTKKAVYECMRMGVVSQRKTFIGFIDKTTQTLFLDPDNN